LRSQSPQAKWEKRGCATRLPIVSITLLNRLAFFIRKYSHETVMSALIEINIVAARMWNFCNTQQERRSKMNAADVMVTNVITVHPDVSVKEIAEILLANRISALPVVDEAGSLVGIVSEADLIHRAEVGTERPSSWWLEFLAGKEALAQDFIKSHARRAADVMTRHVIAVTADTPLTRIVSLLEKHRIKRVPVVDNGKVIGIVSRANLVQALLRSQQDISPQQPVEGSISGDDVVTQLESEPWWPGNVNVIINDGAAELWGVVESQVQRDAIRVAIEAIPGLRTISNKISVQQRVRSAY
jgi:CBS domain-containing protein